MGSCNVLLILCAIHATFLACDALFLEGLVSDNKAPEYEFTYIVAIMGKPNFTDQLELMCTGGIIAPDKILAAAQCFVDEKGKHRNFTFSIIADTTDVNNSRNIETDIDLIFLVNQEPYFISDISVALLAGTLNNGNSTNLSKLRVPWKFEQFWTQIGIVAGYGYYKMETSSILEDLNLKRLSGESDGLLRYFKIRISYTMNCMFGHRVSSDHNVICGKPVDVPRGKRWGICENDAGSPLVIGDAVVAVASSSHTNCDDTLSGGLYTSIAVYDDFIGAILNERPLNYTIIYYNRPHKLK